MKIYKLKVKGKEYRFTLIPRELTAVVLLNDGINDCNKDDFALTLLNCSLETSEKQINDVKKSVRRVILKSKEEDIEYVKNLSKGVDA